MDFRKCSKSAKEDCSCCPLFSSLCFSSLLASLLAYFERLWQRAIELQSLFFMNLGFPLLCHGFQIAPPSFGMLELIHKLIKTYKLATKWLKRITKDLNELIGLNEYDYYSKVHKTIIIRSTKLHFLVVISNLVFSQHKALSCNFAIYRGAQHLQKILGDRSSVH